MTDNLIDPHTGEQMELVRDSANSDGATAQPQAATPVADTPLQKRMRTWTGLPFEQFQLLRLTPLQADRATGLRPLLFANLARVSRHSKEISMLRLKVELPNQKHASQANYLELWVDHLKQEIRCNPEHGLVVEPGNRGLGRFLLATAIGWCSPLWKDYHVKTLALSNQFIKDEQARLRRDHALQGQGFTVDYLDSVNMTAACTALKLESLHAHWNKDKVRVVEHTEAAHLLLSADQNIKAQTHQLNQLADKMSLLQRDDKTLKFTILTLVSFAVFQAGLLIWMATR